MLTRSRLAILFSGLEGFSKPDAGKEQYSTDPEVAASLLWNANMLGDIKAKVVADLGSGTGILGLGALALGARFVYFIEQDEGAMKIAKTNFEIVEKMVELKGKSHFFIGDIGGFGKKVDVVVQNPPFGVQKAHADRAFLEKSFKVADVVYSLHKIESKVFLEGFAREHGFKITHMWQYNYPLKQSMGFHTHRIKRIQVGCWRFAKQQ